MHRRRSLGTHWPLASPAINEEDMAQSCRGDGVGQVSRGEATYGVRERESGEGYRQAPSWRAP